MTDDIKAFNFGRIKEPITNAQEVNKQLSALGTLIWQVIQNDDEISELIFELADAKLSLDKVSQEDTRLGSDWAEAIMGDLEPEILDQRRPCIPAREWMKYSLFNFALDWVMDQALMRMRIEQRWSFQENDGLSRS